MEDSKFRRYLIIGQIGGWFLLGFIIFTAEIPWTNTATALLYSLNFLFFMMGLVYLQYHLLLPLYLKGNWLLYGILVLILIFTFNFLSLLSDQLLIPYSDPEYGSDDSIESIIYMLPLSMLVVLGSNIYYFVEQWFVKTKQSAMLQSEKLQAELNFLKSQINPHFLFNTLNNIYSFVQTGHENASPMLERLSGILRYVVYDCQEKTVNVTKEVQAIEDLLEIYKMKNSRQENITLGTSGITGHFKIAPLVLVNLVENACKHSDAASNPSGFLKVDLSIADNNCTLYISNSFNNSRKLDEDGGVGMGNVIKRLDLQFEKKYLLEEEKSGNTYQLQLKFPIDKE
ncbi:MAG: histidine kinase [bacterium]|nr:histidine kinase [bacterium]